MTRWPMLLIRQPAPILRWLTFQNRMTDLLKTSSVP